MENSSSSRTRKWWAPLAVSFAMTVTGAAPVQSAEFTTDFRYEDCTWSSTGNQNPYFNLDPGYELEYAGEDDGESVDLEITVENRTERITFRTPSGRRLTVNARVVEERESINGELFEVSRNWYARCQQTSDIYYFGEDVDFYEDGQVVRHDGAWRAGRDGALPGIIMPGTFLLGSRYFQEIAPGIALDQAKHVAMGLDVEVPAGRFSHCVKVKETTPLEPGSVSVKIYCPGVGLVSDGDVLELEEFGHD